LFQLASSSLRTRPYADAKCGVGAARRPHPVRLPVPGVPAEARGGRL